MRMNTDVPLLPVAAVSATRVGDNSPLRSRRSLRRFARSVTVRATYN